MEEHKNDAPTTTPKTVALASGIRVTRKMLKNWEKQAAKTGNKARQIDALTSLAECYGDGIFVDKNGVTETMYCRRAAMLGDAMAQFNLCVNYNEGIGVEKNAEIAAMWCGKAAKQGDSDAQCNLGVCFDQGKGVEQNYKTAVHWYSKAAAQGNAGAQSNLGFCFDHGKGVEQNYKTAAYWYSKAAAQGYARAQSNLGVCFQHGKGAEQSYDKAVHWFSKAAQQGYAGAQYNLGFCFEDGQGVPKDLHEAKRLYKLAADQGFVPAIAALASLLRKGPDADLDKSNKLLRKAKKVAAAGTDDYHKQLAQKIVLEDMSNLRCSNEGCAYALSIDLSEDGRKKGKMKVCANCHQTQYCCKECQVEHWKAGHKHECKKLTAQRLNQGAREEDGECKPNPVSDV